LLRIGNARRELQRGGWLNLVELPVRGVELVVDLNVADRADERPLVVASPRRQDVRHVVALLAEDGPQRELAGGSALTDLYLERFLGADHRHGRVAAGF